MAKIRLWKLGNLEHKIAPSREAVAKLKEILEGARTSDQEEPFEIIWGPDIEVQVFEGDSDVLIASEEAAILFLETRGFKITHPTKEPT